MDAPVVYLDKMAEALKRLQVSEQYLTHFQNSASTFERKRPPEAVLTASV
jgi:hypothetical protein